MRNDSRPIPHTTSAKRKNTGVQTLKNLAVSRYRKIPVLALFHELILQLHYRCKHKPINNYNNLYGFVCSPPIQQANPDFACSFSTDIRVRHKRKLESTPHLHMDSLASASYSVHSWKNIVKKLCTWISYSPNYKDTLLDPRMTHRRKSFSSLRRLPGILPRNKFRSGILLNFSQKIDR